VSSLGCDFLDDASNRSAQVCERGVPDTAVALVDDCCAPVRSSSQAHRACRDFKQAAETVAEASSDVTEVELLTAVLTNWLPQRKLSGKYGLDRTHLQQRTSACCARRNRLSAGQGGR